MFTAGVRRLKDALQPSHRLVRFRLIRSRNRSRLSSANHSVGARYVYTRSKRVPPSVDVSEYVTVPARLPPMVPSIDHCPGRSLATTLHTARPRLPATRNSSVACSPMSSE